MSTLIGLVVLVVAAFSLALAAPVASADSVTYGSHSLLTGSPFSTSPWWPYPGQSSAQTFATSNDLAYQGNGFASQAVAKDVIPGYDPIHRAQNANDGLYGNGASWISNSWNSWVRIDLGRTVAFDVLTFGRDRLAYFGDRDPGQFTISVSTDGTNYQQVLNSSPLGFSGHIPQGATVVAQFASVSARYVKLSVQNPGAAIDEIEVRQTDSFTPVTTSSVAPQPSTAGWNTTDTTVSLSATDNPGGSGVKEITYSLSGAQSQASQTVTGSTAQVVVSSEGTTTVTFHATDQAGNSEQDQQVTVKLDKTAPAVSYIGNMGTYTVDQTVAIHCSATDDVSGVETSTCADVNAPAYTLGLGVHVLSDQATDNAGNTGTGSTTYTVVATYTSLDAVVQQFSTDPAVSAGMGDKLDAAMQAAARGNANAKAGQIRAFKNQVAAQDGKALTHQQAVILTDLASAL